MKDHHGMCKRLSKYFNPFGYIVVHSYLPALVIFTGYTWHLTTSEGRTFRCPSSPESRDDCLEKYDEQYNSPFPLYRFVLLCLVPLLVVCIACSWCFVKSRVDVLETALKAEGKPSLPTKSDNQKSYKGPSYAVFLHFTNCNYPWPQSIPQYWIWLNRSIFIHTKIIFTWKILQEDSLDHHGFRCHLRLTGR